MSDDRRLRDAAIAAAMRAMGSPIGDLPTSGGGTTSGFVSGGGVGGVSSSSRRYATGHSLGSGGFGPRSTTTTSFPTMTSSMMATTRTTSQRPEEHFITISQNGTILGATETITGVPPNSLLMKSNYDTIHEDDVVGLKAISKYFWEKGQPTVEAYFRRQTLEGKWIWLSAKVATTIDVPVPGAILQEKLVEHSQMAELIARTTRMAAILMESIELAHNPISSCSSTNGSGSTSPPGGGQTTTTKAFSGGDDLPPELESLAGSESEREVLRAFLGIDSNSSSTNLRSTSSSGGGRAGSTSRTSGLRSLLDRGGGGGGRKDKKNGKPLSTEGNSEKATRRNSDGGAGGTSSSGNLSGGSLDLGKMLINPAELKIVCYVLLGKIPINELGSVIASSLNHPNPDLSGAMDTYVQQREEAIANSTSTRTAAAASAAVGSFSGHSMIDYSTTTTTSPVQAVGNFIHRRRDSRGMGVGGDGADAAAGGTTISSLNIKGPSSTSRIRRDKRGTSIGSSTGSVGGGSDGFGVVSGIRDAVLGGRRSRRSSSSSQQHQQQQTIRAATPDSAYNMISTASDNELLLQQHEQQQQQYKPMTPLMESPKLTIPHITIVNLSYSGIGNSGMELLSSMLVEHDPVLRTLDVSFCDIEERGMLAFARAMGARKRKGFNHLEGVFVSGNYISYKSAKELGVALSSAKEQRHFRKKLMRDTGGTGYDEDDEWDEDDDEEEMDILFGSGGGGGGTKSSSRGTDGGGSRSKGSKKDKSSSSGGNAAAAGASGSGTTTSPDKQRRRPRRHPSTTMGSRSLGTGGGGTTTSGGKSFKYSPSKGGLGTDGTSSSSRSKRRDRDTSTMDRKMEATKAGVGGGGSVCSATKAAGSGGGGTTGNPATTTTTTATTATNSSNGPNIGLQMFHAACCSLNPVSFCQLLLGLGPDCPIRELNVSSNNLGSDGASQLMAFLEGKGIPKYKKGQPVMAKLDRIDMSNNNLGNEGTTKLTRAISKRTTNVNIVELRLSSNEIGASGIETIMNKLLQHNILNLSLENNVIADRGCQLIAASLSCMHHLSRLSLSFNQIGSRGVNALMRALVGCESLKHLGLSGNIIKISGSIGMGFALSQHPRLSSLELENCCLSQVAQCHITAGIISNRWVPMKHLNGFVVGPPMVAIGALDVVAQGLSNEECFRIRRDISMKAIFDWMETNRGSARQLNAASREEALANNMPAQSAYHRMLDWLSRIPFDEDELSELRSYFYDADGGDGDRTSDGNINLRLRGDLLAALGSEVVDEIREETNNLFPVDDNGEPVGLDICSGSDDDDDDEEGKDRQMKMVEENEYPFHEIWRTFDAGRDAIHAMRMMKSSSSSTGESDHRRKGMRGGGTTSTTSSHIGPIHEHDSNYTMANARKRGYSDSFENAVGDDEEDDEDESEHHHHLEVYGKPLSRVQMTSSKNTTGHMSICSRRSMDAGGTGGTEEGDAKSNTSSAKGGGTTGGASNKQGKARINMFRPFAEKLEMLKGHAQEMMDHEPDPYQQDIIAQQFAEASLTLLRQLRYHCMNSGLDGWRQGKLRRKVLIVDDSMVTRKMVSRAFEKANFIVDTAANGEEGVMKLKESIYDIAFMDIDMPIMNGFDATKALRDWEDLKRPGARQPICALTAAYVDDFERSELMKFKEAGLDVMESKPCNIPRLFKVVDDVSPMFSDLSISVTQTQKQLKAK